MFFLRKPSPSRIARFLAESANLPLSYRPVGLAANLERGFRLDRAEVELGFGADVFERACQALREWQQFALGWTAIEPPSAPLEIDSVVAVRVRHFGFWSLNGCRIVSICASDPAFRRFGFAYGTLTNHAESGEEIFAVALDERTGRVTYQLRAASRPRALLAWIGFPATRALQARFRRDSCRAMARAVAEMP